MEGNSPSSTESIDALINQLPRRAAPLQPKSFCAYHEVPAVFLEQSNNALQNTSREQWTPRIFLEITWSGLHVPYHEDFEAAFFNKFDSEMKKSSHKPDFWWHVKVKNRLEILLKRSNYWQNTSRRPKSYRARVRNNLVRNVIFDAPVQSPESTLQQPMVVDSRCPIHCKPREISL